MLVVTEIAKNLKKLGVKKVFIYPGGTIAPLLDALINVGIGYVCFRNEQGAGYAAIGAAKYSGETQVVMVTSGPGATNLLSSVADAYYDSVPLLIFTGQVGTADINTKKKIRQTGFQETDTVNLYSHVTKESSILTSKDNITEKIVDSYKLTQNGRVGPVLIDLPMDVQQSELKYFESNPNIFCSNDTSCEKIDFRKILEMLEKSEKPLILAGNGIYISKSVDLFRSFVENSGLPVVSSMPGIGTLPTDDNLYFGFVGHTGEFYANLAMYYSDLLLVLGARLDLRQTGTEIHGFKENKHIIRVDIDRNELEFGRVKADLDVNMDLKKFLEQANNEFETKISSHTWLKKLVNWKNKFHSSQFYEKKILSGMDIIKSVDNHTKDDTVVVSSGVGTHQQLTARYFNFDYPERRWMTSAGHGTMGFDLPSVIGAISEADEGVLGIVFAGDGSIQMNIQELATLKELNLPIKIFVLDNQRLGIVSQFQLMNWKDDPSTGQKNNPSFSKIAQAYGIDSYDIKNKEEINEVLGLVFRDERPVLVHCHVDPSEDVLPMLLGGQNLNQMYPFEREEL